LSRRFKVVVKTEDGEGAIPPSKKYLFVETLGFVVVFLAFTRQIEKFVSPSLFQGNNSNNNNGKILVVKQL